MESGTTQPNPVNTSPHYSPISIGEWLITAIIFAIPLVGFVMLFVWGFGGNTQPSKANWAKATLIVMGISMVMGFIFLGSILGIMGAIIN